jgi:hypothetical protein
VRVTADVVDHLLWSGKGWLGVLTGQCALIFQGVDRVPV